MQRQETCDIRHPEIGLPAGHIRSILSVAPFAWLDCFWSRERKSLAAMNSRE